MFQPKLKFDRLNVESELVKNKIVVSAEYLTGNLFAKNALKRVYLAFLIFLQILHKLQINNNNHC